MDQKLRSLGLTDEQIETFREIIGSINQHVDIEIRCYENQGYDLNVNSRQNARRAGLKITWPDGRVIEGKAAEIFDATIKEVGAERIYIWQQTTKIERLVSDQEENRYTKPIQDGFYVISNANTAKRARLLNKLSEGLNLGFVVEEI